MLDDNVKQCAMHHILIAGIVEDTVYNPVVGLFIVRHQEIIATQVEVLFRVQSKCTQTNIDWVGFCLQTNDVNH